MVSHLCSACLFPYRGKAVLAGHTSTAVFLFRNFGWRATKPQGNQAVNNQCYVTQNAFAHLCSNSSRPQSVPCNIEYRSTIPPEASLPQRPDPSATRLRRAKPAKTGKPLKQIVEPYVDRLDKLLTDYLRAIQTPK